LIVVVPFEPEAQNSDLPQMCANFGLGTLAADRGRLVVALYSGATIEDLGIALGDRLMKSEKIGLQLSRGPRLQLEMMETIFAPRECRNGLAQGRAIAGWNVADRKANARVGRWIWRRAVHQTNVMERHFAGPQGQSDRLRRIDFDLNLLSACQQVVLVERIAMRDLVQGVIAGNHLHYAIGFIACCQCDPGGHDVRLAQTPVRRILMP